MQIRVHPSADAPIYRQIVRQVEDALASGRLRPGERLPSHRELARELVVSPLTVKKAYDELERAGRIHTLRGQGTFASARVEPRPPAERREALRPQVRWLVAEARLAGLSPEDLRALLDEEQARLGAEPGSAPEDEA